MTGGRVVDTALLARLGEVSTTSVCDADPTVGMMAGLVCINTPRRVAGPARTVSSRGDLLPVLRGLQSLQPGEVLVVDASAAAVAVAGELFTMHAATAGAAALVVGGYVRDVEMLRSLAMPVYARGVVPRAGRAQAWGEEQVRVTCGGVAVAPGDIVHADADGVIVASAEQLRAALARAVQIEETEARIRDGLRDGRSLFDMLNFDEVAAAVAEQDEHALRLRPPD